MYRNMKIEITDEPHLKAVCDVLESMGYECVYTTMHGVGSVATTEYGGYLKLNGFFGCNTTLSDLLKMRDDMVKEKRALIVIHSVTNIKELNYERVSG